MAYSTIEDLTELHGEAVLTELTFTKKLGPRPTTIDEPVAQRAINSGDGIIDSYIGQRVSLPIPVVPSFINTLSIDLATYYLHKKNGNTGGKDNANYKLYEDAIKHLERFAKGETSLGLAIFDDATADDDNEVSHHADISSEVRQFTRKTMGQLT